jgi:ABC-type phosphate/phosphonate transport system permease subunit
MNTVDICVVVAGFLFLAWRLSKQKTKRVVVGDEANMYRATIRPLFPPDIYSFSFFDPKISIPAV